MYYQRLKVSAVADAIDRYDENQTAGAAADIFARCIFEFVGTEPEPRPVTNPPIIRAEVLDAREEIPAARDYSDQPVDTDSSDEHTMAGCIQPACFEFTLILPTNSF